RAYSPFGSSTTLGLRPIGIYRTMNILKHNYAQRQVPDNCRDNNFLRASSLLLILALFSWFSVSGCGGVAGKNTTPQGNGQLSAFNVQFAPTATGSASGSVSLVSDAPNSPSTIALSGTGVQPQLSVTPPSVSFGNVLVGSTGVQNFTLTNSGGASLTIAQG